MFVPQFLHFFAAGIPIILSGIGTGIGQGIASVGALDAMTRQKEGTTAIFRTMILGLALIETGAILSLVITLMTLFGGPFLITTSIGIAELGLGLAIGISSLSVSIASSFTVKAACESIARQPLFATKISTLMLFAQSIIEAPVIFAFVIALLIKTHITQMLTMLEGVKLFSAGLAIGLGSIGPSIGQAIFTQSSCIAIGLNKKAFGKIFTFSLLSQAVVETPVIFCMLVSIALIFKPIHLTTPLAYMVMFIAPALTVSIGSLGTSIATGYAASKSSRFIALKPEHYPMLLRTSLLGQAIMESSAIYALIIALTLMTKKL